MERSEVFLETKVWITEFGYDETLHAFEKSTQETEGNPPRRSTC